MKTVETITAEPIGHAVNYRRITGSEVGLILSFKHPELELRCVTPQEGGRRCPLPIRG